MQQINLGFSVNPPNGNLSLYFPKDFPKELVLCVLSCLPTCKDLCSVSLTCKNLYAIRGEDGPWKAVFHRYFPGSQRLVPEKSWLEACQSEYRMISHVINGVYAYREFSIGEGETISGLALADNGQMMISCGNGSIRAFNRSAGGSSLIMNLVPPNSIYAFAVGDDLCAVACSEGVIRVFNFITREEIQVPQGISGLALNDGVNCLKLAGGQLLISCDDLATPIHVWDPRSEEESRIFKSSDRALGDNLALCGRTLFSNFVAHEEIAGWNLDTNTSTILFHPDPSGYFGATAFIASSETMLFSRPCTGTIFGWNVGCDQPIFSGRLWEKPVQKPWYDDVQRPEDSLKFLGTCSQNGEERRFSFGELLPLLNGFLVNEFEFMHCAGIGFFTELPQKNSVHLFPIFGQGGLFFTHPMSNTLCCMDFTATDEEVLHELIQALRSKDDQQIASAKQRLSRMPMYPAIQSIYEATYDPSSSLDDPTHAAGALAEAILGYLEGFKEPTSQ